MKPLPSACHSKSWLSCDQKTHGVDVEGVGPHEGDGILQVIVVHPILVILVGHHGQSKGPHAVPAPVGQLHLQGDRVPNLAGHHGVTVTDLAINQDVCKSRKQVLIRLDTCLQNDINLDRRLNQKKVTSVKPEVGDSNFGKENRMLGCCAGDLLEKKQLMRAWYLSTAVERAIAKKKKNNYDLYTGTRRYFFNLLPWRPKPQTIPHGAANQQHEVKGNTNRNHQYKQQLERSRAGGPCSCVTARINPSVWRWAFGAGQTWAEFTMQYIY